MITSLSLQNDQTVLKLLIYIFHTMKMTNLNFWSIERALKYFASEKTWFSDSYTKWYSTLRLNFWAKILMMRTSKPVGDLSGLKITNGCRSDNVTVILLCECTCEGTRCTASIILTNKTANKSIENDHIVKTLASHWSATSGWFRNVAWSIGAILLSWCFKMEISCLSNH